MAGMQVAVDPLASQLARWPEGLARFWPADPQSAEPDAESVAAGC